MATQAVDSRICRSCDSCIGGVCAGLAERFDLDPIVVRILAIFIGLLTAGLGVIAYIVLWVRLPQETEQDAPYEVMPESAESSAFGDVDCVTGRVAGSPWSKPASGISLGARLAIAAGIMLLFLAVSINLSPFLPGTEWWQFWPLALLITGLCLIIIPVPTRYEAAWHALGIVITSVAATLIPITLNIVAWETIPNALSQGWLLLALAAIVFAGGVYRKSNALMICASFFVVAFCIFTLALCSLPGVAESLTLHMPDGRSMRIAFSNL